MLKYASYRPRRYRSVHLLTKSLQLPGYLGFLRNRYGNLRVLSQVDFLDAEAIRHRLDLLIVDTDAFPTGEVGYIIFLANCLLPGISIVLMSSEPMAEQDRNRYLNCVSVLDVVCGDDAANSAVYMC